MPVPTTAAAAAAALCARSNAAAAAAAAAVLLPRARRPGGDVSSLPERFAWLAGGSLLHGHLLLPELAGDDSVTDAAEYVGDMRQLLLQPSGAVSSPEDEPHALVRGLARAGRAARACTSCVHIHTHSPTHRPTPARMFLPVALPLSLSLSLSLPLRPSLLSFRSMKLAFSLSRAPTLSLSLFCKHVVLHSLHRPQVCSEYHYLLLYADKLAALNQVSGRRVAEVAWGPGSHASSIVGERAAALLVPCARALQRFRFDALSPDAAACSHRIACPVCVNLHAHLPCRQARRWA